MKLKNKSGVMSVEVNEKLGNLWRQFQRQHLKVKKVFKVENMKAHLIMV
jgi:hypothetical protein